MTYNIVQSADPAAMYKATNSFSNGVDMNYLKEKHQQYTASLSSLGNNFSSKLGNAFNYMVNNTVVKQALNTLAMTGNITGDERIYLVNDQNFKQTGYLMRQYVMANPTIFNDNRRNRIIGYDGEWFDKSEGIDNPYHREDYYNAVDQVMQFNNEGVGMVSFVSGSEDNPLNIDERLIINDTWDRLNEMLASGEDPTDLF